MRRLVIFLLAISVSLSAWPPAARAADWLRLENFVLIDGNGAAPRAVRRLLARDGTIVALGDDDPRAPAPFEVVTAIDLGGAFVIPGLIDSHVHFSGYPGDREGIAARMAQALRGGITSVRDMAGDARVLEDSQRAVLRREFDGVTVASSVLVGGPTMFADPRVVLGGIGYAAGEAPWLLSITPQTDLALALARARGAGVDGVKIYGNLDAASVAAVAAEARRQGLALWAHATVFPARPGELLDAGVEVLSHAPYLVWEAVEKVPDDYGARREGPYDKIRPRHRRIRALLQRMAASGVLLDTTLLIYRDAIRQAEGEQRGAWAQGAFEWGVEVVQFAHELGVPLAAGTDRFAKDDWSLPDLHGELAILVEQAGLTPLEALVAATRNGARAAGIAATRGTVEVGMAADLVVLETDPTQDISATQQIRLVIKDGRVVHVAQPQPALP